MSIPLELQAYAKVNLRLAVLFRRPDGYHEIESIMIGLDLHDTLKVSQSDDLTMDCDDPSLPTDESNLILKAANRFSKAINKPVHAHFSLTKRIPTGAGLGGGSSDAATALVALNQMHDSPLSLEELEAIAKDIGADVPFFIRPGHKIARGIGERLSPVRLGTQFWVALVNPGFEVSTPYIYRSLRLTEERKEINLPPFLADLRQVVGLLRNDLEPVVLERYPQVGKIKDFLETTQCTGCLMSGSGPTVFGIYKDARSLDRAISLARDKGWRAWKTRTLSNEWSVGS